MAQSVLQKTKYKVEVQTYGSDPRESKTVINMMIIFIEATF